MRKVCIFTSTRADWGQVRGLADAIRQSGSLKLQLLVSGTHLSERFGMTISEIKSDGFDVSEQIDILKFDDTPVGICATMGLALRGYGEALERLRPELLVILGDRYEAFCAAAAAQIGHIPVAHIHGGETTEGAVDEAFRHSITKMAHLHFPSCEEYRNRIIQLGEHPSRVFNVGALALENIHKISLAGREDLEKSIGFALDHPFFLVTFHPATLERSSAGAQFDALLSALDEFPDHKIVFTKANADADGRIINEKIDAHTKAHPARCLGVTSLGLRRYLSVMKLCAAVVGNSSSGILEAPVLGVPTVNIGDRQKGRLRVKSIIDCEPEHAAIVKALRVALDPAFLSGIKKKRHPCDHRDTADNIVKILCDTDLNGLLKKTFFNLPAQGNK